MRSGALRSSTTPTHELRHIAHLRPLRRGPSDRGGRSAREPDADWDGVTQAAAGAAAQRFLTDVIVELGLADARARRRRRSRGRADRRATLEEALLAAAGRSRQDQLARAIAERYGLDHVDLDASRSTWRRPT